MGGWYGGSRLQTVYAYGSGRNAVLSLGSADSPDESVTYYTAALRVIMEDDSTSLAIVRAPDASQKVFRVNADNAIDIRSGTVIIGSAETGALDSVIGEIRLMGGATLNTYVKKIGRRRKIEKYFGRGRLQFQGRRDFRRRGSSLVRGRLFHTGRNYKLRFYRFQSWRRRIRPHKADAGFSLNGSPEDLSMDFGIIGLDPECYTLAFADSGTVLRLSVVPEPAAFAAALGAAALALAGRRAKRR